MRTWGSWLAEQALGDEGSAVPVAQSLDQANRELLERLWYANEVFRDEGDGGLEGCKRACAAILAFLQARMVNPELGAPLFSMFKAFEDLERGVSPELFSADTAIRERSRSSMRKQAQFLASVAAEVLVRLGQSVDAATAEIAAEIAQWGIFRKQVPDATTIANWRKPLRSEDDPRNRDFQRACEELMSQPDPRAAVRTLLASRPGVAGT